MSRNWIIVFYLPGIRSEDWAKRVSFQDAIALTLGLWSWSVAVGELMSRKELTLKQSSCQLLCEYGLKSIVEKFPVSMDLRRQIQYHVLLVCLQDNPNPQFMFCHRSNLFSAQTTSLHRLHIFTLTELFDFYVWNLLDFCIHSSPKLHSGLGRSSPYHNWLTGDLLSLPLLSKLLLTMTLDLAATRKTKLRRCQAGGG